MECGMKAGEAGEGMRVGRMRGGEVDRIGLRHLWFNLMGLPPLK